MKINRFASFLALLLLFASYGYADPAPSPKSKNLQSILVSIQKLNRDLASKQEEIRSQAGEGRRDEITREIQTLVERLNQLESNFQEIASEVDPDAFVAKQEETSVDWSKDLQEILSPLINEVRRLTQRPREMDRLRSSIEEYEVQLSLLDRAEENVRKETERATSPELVQHLSLLTQEFDSRRQSIRTQLGIASQKLEARLSERKTFSESVQNIFQLFFKSRGLNLILATLCAFGFWLLARRLQAVGGRYFTTDRERGFYARLISVLFTLSAIMGAIVAFLLALYFVGDWVLLILALMLILGIIWTSKQAVHQFWTHASLLLNMGASREGERVIYNGIPWRIDSLNFYTHLVNPALTGGSLYLPIRDLSEMRSRSFDPQEPWFPTLPGDWILWKDDLIARVVHQSVEQVQIVFLGGSIATVPTAKFFEEGFKVLSRGFRHSLSFGVDYELQDGATDDVPEKLKEVILRGLIAEGFQEELKSLIVEFEEASASSLNMAIMADFEGSAAASYNRLKRLILKLCVDACNKHNWVIPFTQMTVHVAEKKEVKGPSVL